MLQMTTFLLGAAVIAAAIASPSESSSGIACNLGDLQSHHVALGFSACITVFNFERNTVFLSASYNIREPWGYEKIPGWKTNRKAECGIKQTSEGLLVNCRCYEDKCNTPMSPKDLLRTQFGNHPSSTRILTNKT